MVNNQGWNATPVHLQFTPESIMDGESDRPYVFTTLRWDPNLPSPGLDRQMGDPASQFYLVENHADRLNHACNSGFLAQTTPSQPPVVTLHALIQELSNAVTQWYNDPGNGSAKCLRIKHRVYEDGRTMTECWPIPRLPPASCFPGTFGTPQTLQATHIEWTVVLDQKPTASSWSTKCKTSDRQAYDRAREDAGIGSLASQQECLLYNHDCNIIDATITTPYFFRDGLWITPSVKFGGQQGTTRRWALEQGRTSGGVIQRSSLRSHEVIWLSNAVRGFFPARFVASTIDNAASPSAA